MRPPSLDDYVDAFDHVALRRDEAGVLEVRLHTDGGPLVWGDGPHTELAYCFATIGADVENRVVLLTGTGESFCEELDDSWVGTMGPAKWDKIFSHGQRLLGALLDIGAPVVAAVNGPARVHAELAVLSDVVVASERAVFQDAPHFRYGAVPGDGVHVIWPLLLGFNRGRRFLLTGERIDARRAEELGVVGEVVPSAQLMLRARAVAADLARQPTTALRYTRAVFTHQLKRLMLDNLGFGLALEGLAAYESWPTGGES